MIMTVEELREYITTTDSDKLLEARLSALEIAIRDYTHNRFHAKPLVRIEAFVRGGVFLSDSLIPFSEGDTVHVTKGSQAVDLGLFTVKEIAGDTTFTVNEPVSDMDDIKVTLVKYDLNIKMGIVNLMRWEAANRDKVGIQSETISRHSVTYADANGDNSIMGYPKALMGFLKPYMKLRF